MLRALARVDALVAFSRPAWSWIGQLAVVILGIHLAADHLDDRVAAWLATLRIAWPDPEAPLAVATWCAVVVELAVSGWAAFALLSARAEPVTTAREWWERRSIRAVLAPALFGATGLAGCWVVQMAAEDLTAPLLLSYAPPLAWMVAALAGWRLAGPGALRVARRTVAPRRRTADLEWVPFVLVITALALLHGLPLHGLPVRGWLP